MRLLACFAIAVFAGSAAADDPPAGRPRMRTLAFSGDGRYLVATSAANEDYFRTMPQKAGAASKYHKPPGYVSVWEMPTGKRIYHREEPRGFAAAAVSPDGSRLALSPFGGDIQIIALATGKVERELPAQGVTALALAFFRDGKNLASTNDDGIIRLWNMDTGAARKPFTKKYEGHLNGHDIAISGDGKTLACFHEATVPFVDLASGKELQVFQNDGTQWAGLHAHAIAWTRVHFTADDRHVVMRSLHGTLAIRECATGKWVFWHEPESSWGDVAISRDSKWVAFSGESAKVLPVDLSAAGEAASKEVRRLAKNWEDERLAVRDRASKEIVALGIPALDELRRIEKESVSPEIRLRSRLARDAIRAPQAAFEMRHPEGIIDRVAISPDGRTLATGSAPGVVRLWSLVTGREILVLRQFPDEPAIPRREF